MAAPAAGRRRAAGGRLWVAACLALALGPGRPRPARAQACCAGGSATVPARLKLHERGLLGLQLHAGRLLGWLPAAGGHRRNAAGDADWELAQVLVGGLRRGRGQAGLALPMRQNVRQAGGRREVGGGLGDLTVAWQHDVVYPGESAHLPGLALAAAATLPSGRPPEAATGALAVDATGAGTWELAAGGSAAWVAGAWAPSVAVQAHLPLPRRAAGLRLWRGAAVGGQVALARVFGEGAAVALSAACRVRQEGTVDGAPVPRSGQALTTVALSAGAAVAPPWRLATALAYDLPLLGRNHATGLALSATVARAWL